MSQSRLARVVPILILGGFVATVRGDQPAKVDPRGDALPAGAIARLGTVRFRHGDGASFVAFLPGGKELLTVGRDETVRLWDVATGKELRYFRLREENAGGSAGQLAPGLTRPSSAYAAFATGIALTADGKTLAYSSNLPPIRLFDVSSGKELRTISSTRGGAGVLFTPDGKTLAVQDLAGPIRLHDVATGKELKQLGPTGQDANRPTMLARGSMAFSSDGKMLVTGTTLRRPAETSPVIFWDTATGKELRRITEGADQFGQVGVRSPAFSPDGKLLAWIKGNNEIILADPSTGKEVRQLARASDARLARVPSTVGGSLLFAPDSKTLVALDASGSRISIWDVELGRELRSVATRSVVRGVSSRTSPSGRAAFSPDNKLLALAGEGCAIRILDIATGRDINAGGHLTAITELGYARDGKTVVAADADKTVFAWDVATGKELRRNQVAGNAIALSVSNDGRHFVSKDLQRTIVLHDAITGKETRQEVPANLQELAILNAMAVSTDNRLVAVAGMMDETVVIHVCDVTTGKEIHRLLPPTPTADPDGMSVPTSLRVPSALQFSPDGQFLVAPFEGDKLVFWNLATGREAVHIETPQRSAVLAFAFSRDGRSLVVDVGADGPSLYETATGKERRRFGNRPTPGAVPDDDLVRQQARLRMLASPSRLRALGTSYALAISPDGRLVAYGKRGGTIQLWDVATGKELGQLQGHRADVTTLAFAADGKTLASGSADTTILIWDVSTFAASANQHTGELNADARWQDLSADDAAKAFDAICAFSGAPERAVPLLKESNCAPPP